VSEYVVEWSTEDPDLAKVLRTIAAYPEGSTERMELEAVLHEFVAARLRERVGAARRSRQRRT
jgi:hypothetical protein